MSIMNRAKRFCKDIAESDTYNAVLASANDSPDTRLPELTTIISREVEATRDWIGLKNPVGGLGKRLEPATGNNAEHHMKRYVPALQRYCEAYLPEWYKKAGKEVFFS